jgi:16S rRNA (cytosine967-C5)-methyltransferase
MNNLAGAARASAARAVSAVMAGRSLDVALDAVRAATPSGDMALVQEMTYGTLRAYNQLRFIVEHFLQKTLRQQDQDVLALLLIGLYQLRGMRVPPHAAVAQTVAATKAMRKEWAKALVNAILRGYLREAASLEPPIAADPVLRHSHPAWLLEALQQDWPAQWEAIASANNEHAPMALRVNLQRTTRGKYLAMLTQAGVGAQAGADVDSAVVLARPAGVQALPGFGDGLVSVQDLAAQYAAVLLDAQAGQRVLDACAAPGGKTAHVLERTRDIDLLAVDIDAQRLARVRENLSRLHLDAKLVVGDAALPDVWWDGRPFDRILLDAPCSATGVIRRHPDIKLHRRPSDIAQLAATQTRLLAALWPLLTRGGKLLYVTCSVLSRENDRQVSDFCALHADARPVELVIPSAVPRGAGWQILPGTSGMDGFFYACLQKR